MSTKDRPTINSLALLVGRYIDDVASRNSSSSFYPPPRSLPPAYPHRLVARNPAYISTFSIFNLELYLVFSQLNRFLVDHRSMEWRRRMARTGCKADRAAPPFMFRERRSLFASLRVPSPSIDFVLDRSRLFQTFRSTRIRSTRGSSIRHCRGETNLYRCPDTVHQPKMFIIRRCTRTHTYTHTYIYIYIYIYAHNTRTRTRGNFLYSRQITGHASLSREANARSRHFLLSSLDPRPAPRNGQKILLSHFRTFYLRHGSEVVVVAVSIRVIQGSTEQRISLSLFLFLSLYLRLRLSPLGNSRSRDTRKEGRKEGETDHEGGSKALEKDVGSIRVLQDLGFSRIIYRLGGQRGSPSVQPGCRSRMDWLCTFVKHYSRG